MSETFAVRTADGNTIDITRERAKWALDHIGPRGRWQLHRFLHKGAVSIRDFEAACRHFGLGHLLVDVPCGDVLQEIEERKARGALPTGRPAPYGMMWDGREAVDATLDVYERRVAEAMAGAGRKPHGNPTEEHAGRTAGTKGQITQCRVGAQAPRAARANNVRIPTVPHLTMSIGRPWPYRRDHPPQARGQKGQRTAMTGKRAHAG